VALPTKLRKSTHVTELQTLGNDENILINRLRGTLIKLRKNTQAKQQEDRTLENNVKIHNSSIAHPLFLLLRNTLIKQTCQNATLKYFH